MKPVSDNNENIAATEEPGFQAASLPSDGPTLALAIALMKRRSVAPNDDGAQALICDRLQRLGFRVCPTRVDGVSSFWADIGAGKTFCFAGHTDVVPPGDAEAWQSPAFSPAIRDGKLYARGAVDMKGQIAAFVTAIERFLQRRSAPPSFRLGMLIAGDEEPRHNHGTLDVLAQLKEQNIAIDYCVVGEPSSRDRVGDVLRVGRRGSLQGRLTVRGEQVHSAHIGLDVNAIHRATKALQSLAEIPWGRAEPGSTPTSLQFVGVSSASGAENIAPRSVQVDFSIRFSHHWTPESLDDAVRTRLDDHGLSFDLEWNLGARPFFTEQGLMTDIAEQAIQATLGQTPERANSGGTSDARFIAPTGAEVVEFGPTGDQAHRVDEHIPIADLLKVSATYEKMLDLLETRLAKGTSDRLG